MESAAGAALLSVSLPSDFPLLWEHLPRLALTPQSGPVPPAPVERISKPSSVAGRVGNPSHGEGLEPGRSSTPFCLAFPDQANGRGPAGPGIRAAAAACAPWVSGGSGAGRACRSGFAHADEVAVVLAGQRPE